MDQMRIGAGTKNAYSNSQCQHQYYYYGCVAAVCTIKHSLVKAITIQTRARINRIIRDIVNRDTTVCQAGLEQGSKSPYSQAVPSATVHCI